MNRCPVVILNTSSPHPCEHVSSLQRWLSTIVPGICPQISLKSQLTSLRKDMVKAILLHGSAGEELDGLRRHAEETFCGAKIFSVAHREAAHTRECIPTEVVEGLCTELTPWLGPHKPFQVLPGVIGCAPSMCKAAGHVALMAQSDATCLLQGETGTGKELFARAIHYMGERKHRPFVPVNCGAIPDSLFENEMFGHVSGAYTDARNTQPGLLAHTANGTLFLDEVDCLSFSAQVKLLRVLQEREYRPVGSTKSISTDVRIIAATNSDLRKRVQQQLFREDLFHRLNVLRLLIPPLRERPGDLGLLALTFIRNFARRYKRPEPRINEDAYRTIEGYDWPGNVREMEAVFERAVLLSSTGVITAEDLGIPINSGSSADTTDMRSAKNRVIMNFERTYLSELLSRCTGNVSRAARMAGKERRSFQRLLRKYNLAAGFSFSHTGVDEKSNH